ncbi:MAG: tRNA (guanosine(37)-N1)-methyltransferase TrmD [Patescibacteria group bacterium]|nr:tRNA (guanosine(37)-N1)-methyltransferase TrmD [Patescibacteria group bacterium]
MKIDLLTLFPAAFEPFFSQSIIAQARKKRYLKVKIHNLRNWTQDKRKTVDDRPFGGGPGMVLKVEPVAKAVKALKEPKSRTVLLSASGQLLNQDKLRRLSKFKHLIIVCGHYEGVDERVAKFYCDEEISVGSYVLSGGESAAAVLVDGLARLIPGVLGNRKSLEEESFKASRLEAGQYTRPSDFEGHRVPKILLSGNHLKIRQWRDKASLAKTLRNRPDLLKGV